ncbi:MAG: LysR family transcriptional regulator [Pseudomonadota bacterium]|nr:LysR family transcriptional regulator [Pseudomonadota bacterium]
MTFDGRLLSGIGVVSAVVEAGSFARAGDALGLTQPAVSRAVGRLEERIGIRIFNRSARAISLTDEGRQFYEMVAPLLSGIEEAAVLAGSAKVEVRGRLRINVDATFGHFILAPRLDEFLDRYPELSVELFVRDSVGDFVGEAIDVAVRFGELDAQVAEAELLLETRVLTCAAPAYLAKLGTPRNPADLAAGHRCILIRDPLTGRPFKWEFQRKRKTVPFAPASRLLVNDTGALVGACLGGAGIAQLLEVYTRDILAAGRLVHLLPDWSDETFPLYAYHRAARLMPAKLGAFLDFVREIIT